MQDVLEEAKVTNSLMAATAGGQGAVILGGTGMR